MKPYLSSVTEKEGNACNLDIMLFIPKLIKNVEMLKPVGVNIN